MRNETGVGFGFILDHEAEELDHAEGKCPVSCS